MMIGLIDLESVSTKEKTRIINLIYLQNQSPTLLTAIGETGH